MKVLGERGREGGRTLDDSDVCCCEGVGGREGGRERGREGGHWMTVTCVVVKVLGGEREEGRALDDSDVCCCEGVGGREGGREGTG